MIAHLKLQHEMLDSKDNKALAEQSRPDFLQARMVPLFLYFSILVACRSAQIC